MTHENDEFGEPIQHAETDTKDQIIERLQKDRDKFKALAEKKFEEGREAALKEVEVKTNVTQWATKVGKPELATIYTNLKDFKPEEASEEHFLKFAEPLGFKPPDQGETPEAGSTPAPATPDPFHRTGAATPTNGQTLTPREVQQKVQAGEMTEAQAIEAVRSGRVVVGAQT